MYNHIILKLCDRDGLARGRPWVQDRAMDAVAATSEHQLNDTWIKMTISTRTTTTTTWTNERQLESEWEKGRRRKGEKKQSTTTKILNLR